MMGDMGMPIRSLFDSTLPAVRRTVALGLALAIGLGPFAAPAIAQDTTPPPANATQAPAAQAPAVHVQLQDYTKPRSHFLNPLAPYIGRTVPEPSFANTARIDQLVRGGTLYLSMNDAIALALENNLDLA